MPNKDELVETLKDKIRRNMKSMTNTSNEPKQKDKVTELQDNLIIVRNNLEQSQKNVQDLLQVKALNEATINNLKDTIANMKPTPHEITQQRYNVCNILNALIARDQDDVSELIPEAERIVNEVYSRIK